MAWFCGFFIAFFLNPQPLQINIEPGTVLLVNKPLRWTSFDAVNKLKRMLLRWLNTQLPPIEGQKRKIKVGHAGTLDPLATGLLIVCVGKETKNIDSYMGMDKTYTGSFYLGATTPSYDLETEVNATFPTNHITHQMIYDAANAMCGAQQQMPPVFSAIKKDGKKAYESARKGEEIQLQPRSVFIHSFEITDISLPLVQFKITCSKGTYIRSIANDFGKLLHSGAYLNSLCRTKIGNFSLENAYQMQDLIAHFGEAISEKADL